MLTDSMSWLLPETFSDAACRRHGAWVLLLFTAVLYLPGLGTLPLMDRDEPRFANATVEMMQRGAWVVPYFNSDPAMTDADRIAAMQKGKGAMEVGYRFDKPPLTYWWMRLHYALFGINEFAARLHTVLSVWLVALVILAMGRRLFSARAGLAAGIAWVTTLQVIVHGRLCVADMPMVLFVTTTGWALMEVLRLLPAPEVPSPSAAFTRWHTLLYVSLGLGFLAKGPIAWLVPVLAVALWRLAFWRKPVAWGTLKLWPGALITLAMVAAWGIPALVQTQGLFWQVGMGEHVVKRGTTAFNGRFPVPGYYLLSALLSLFPWIALLPQVWTRVRAQWDAPRAFLVSWLAAPYLIFSLYATQLPHYVMPGFPAAMLLVMGAGDLGKPGRWGRLARWACPMLFFAVGIGFFSLLWFLWLPLNSQTVLLCFTLGLFFMSVGGLGGWLLGPAEPSPSTSWARWMVMVLQLVVIAACLSVACGELRKLHPATQLAARAGPLPEKIDLVGWQFQEPSLVFHFHHHWRFLSRLPAVDERMGRKGARIVVLQRREWTLNKTLQDKRQGSSTLAPDKDFSREVDALTAAHPDYQVFDFTGINAARASWSELRMLVRK